MSKICVMCDEGVTQCDNCGICAANKRNIDNWLKELEAESTSKDCKTCSLRAACADGVPIDCYC